MTHPIKRDLDGAYFRVERDGKWQNVCFSDMTRDERDQVMEGRPEEWLKSMGLRVVCGHGGGVRRDCGLGG